MIPYSATEEYFEYRDTDVMIDVTHMLDTFFSKIPPITKMTIMRNLEEVHFERNHYHVHIEAHEHIEYQRYYRAEKHYVVYAKLVEEPVVINSI